MTLQPLWHPVAIAIPVLMAMAAGFFAWQRPTARVAWLRRVGVLVILATLLSGPSTQESKTSNVSTTIEITFVVDLTGSMGALDYGEDGAPRLEGVRADLDELVRAFPGSRYSVIAWNSVTTTQLPLTTDGNAVISWANTAKQEITRYSAGSQVDRPLDALTKSLEQAADERPESIRVVFFLSDGENTNGDDSSAAAELASFEGLEPLIDAGAVLGYGTDAGGRMYVYDPGSPDDESFILDEDGEPGVSRIDQDTLRLIAEQMGIDYLHRMQPGGLADIADGIPVEMLAQDGRRELTVRRPVVWPLAIGIVVLLLWEVAEVSRHVRRAKEVTR